MPAVSLVSGGRYGGVVLYVGCHNPGDDIRRSRLIHGQERYSVGVERHSCQARLYGCGLALSITRVHDVSDIGAFDEGDNVLGAVSQNDHDLGDSALQKASSLVFHQSDAVPPQKGFGTAHAGGLAGGGQNSGDASRWPASHVRFFGIVQNRVVSQRRQPSFRIRPLRRCGRSASDPVSWPVQSRPTGTSKPRR